MAGTDRFDVPPEMRVFAEKSVEQARQAFDGFISAAHRAFNDFEGHAESARQGARDVTDKPWWEKWMPVISIAAVGLFMTIGLIITSQQNSMLVNHIGGLVNKLSEVGARLADAVGSA